MDNFIGVIRGQPAKFDWYQGTAAVDAVTLKGILSEVSPGAEWEDLEKAPQGYGAAWRLTDGDGRICDVWAGGAHTYPHFVSSGETAQAVADLVRSELAGLHTVSRVDPCIDFITPGAYEVIQDACIQVSRETKVKLDTKGDHLHTRQGRTVYLGSTASHARVRVYEKADELRAKFANRPDILATIPPELARLEGQIRPKGREAKQAAATASPVELFGSAQWMRHLMRLVADMDLEPFQACPVWRQSDDDRAYAAMLSQYGNLLTRMMENQGDWACVGLQIGSDLAERRNRRY